MDPASFGLPAVAHRAQQPQFQTAPVHTASFIDHHASLPLTRFSTYPLVHPVDPAHLVDYRNFCPYAPNEVRHRKRTSRAQLKVLEETFRHDQKPNPTIRKDLAAQLSMTPRAVQVWFQNRRAKDKNLAKKASLAQQTASVTAGTSGSASDTEAAQPSPTSDSHSVPPSTPIESSRESNSPASPAGSDDSQDTPGDNYHPGAMLGSAGQPTNPLEAAQQDAQTADVDSGAASRRRSLPAASLGQPPPRVRQDVSILNGSRRRSLETNLQRLASHPYAPVVAATATPVLSGTSLSRVQQTSRPVSLHQRNRSNLRLNTDVPSRSVLAHRGSVPMYSAAANRVHGHSPSHSMPGTASTISPPTLLPNRPGNIQYPNLFVPRLPSAPPVIPGPLPAPDFSFGAPMSANRERDSDTESHRTPFRDSEDDSPALGPFSRFGSFASAAESDVTSASASTFVSEFGSDAADFPRVWMAEERRASCPDQVVKLMSSLDFAEPSSELFKANNTSTDGAQQYSAASAVSTPVTPFRGQAYSQSDQPMRTRSELEYALHMPTPEPRTMVTVSPLRVSLVNIAEAGGNPLPPHPTHNRRMSELGAHVPGNAAAASAASSVSSLGIATPLDLPNFGPSFELGHFVTHPAGVHEGDAYFNHEATQQQHAQACFPGGLDANAVLNVNYGYP